MLLPLDTKFVHCCASLIKAVTESHKVYRQGEVLIKGYRVMDENNVKFVFFPVHSCFKIRNLWLPSGDFPEVCP